MRYPINTSAIIDVTKSPYCADNTGKVVLRAAEFRTAFLISPFPKMNPPTRSYISLQKLSQQK